MRTILPFIVTVLGRLKAPSVNSPSKIVSSRLASLAFAAILIWAATDIYHVVRSDRVNTRLSVRLDGSDHESIAALPAGAYQIHFTDAPNVTPVVATSPAPLLPAQITTSVMRGDSRDASKTLRCRNAASGNS